VLPLGTANDFAKGCGIPVNDPEAALMLAAEGEVRNIDVGRVNERVFVNVATGGFGAEVTTSTPLQMKRVLGSAAYSLMGLVTSLKVHAWHTKISFDDELQEGRMIVLAVGNARQAGGGYSLTPYAHVNDGLLDAMAVHDVELTRFGAVLAELGDMRRESNRFVTYRQVERVHLETEEPLQLNLDGEPLYGKCFDFEVVPNRLPFVLPASSPVLQ
jgi:YegS/Rv2252/BmrU family lipid kinase